LHVYNTLTFTKFATYSAYVAKSNFGNFGAMNIFIPLSYAPVNLGRQSLHLPQVGNVLTCACPFCLSAEKLTVLRWIFHEILGIGRLWTEEDNDDDDDDNRGRLAVCC